MRLSSVGSFVATPHCIANVVLNAQREQFQACIDRIAQGERGQPLDSAA